MQPQNRRIPIVRAEAVAASVLRWALHHGDAARGDGAPEGGGLAAPPWDGTTRRPTNSEGPED